MALVRTIKCDLCSAFFTEEDYGKGFPGWAIIQGISKHDPPTDRPLIHEDMQSTFCPKHKEAIAIFIKSLDGGEQS